ncbi:MAG: hypothetical protein F6K52_04105 [Moorea sp. SIO3H5]|nr:hypothetical protein [Moorena sp. SIO3H5]
MLGTSRYANAFWGTSGTWKNRLEQLHRSDQASIPILSQGKPLEICLKSYS